MSDSLNTQFNFTGFTTLKKDLREAVQLYQQMLQSGTATTEQIEAQARVVARLKDEIDDANDATAALTGAGRIQAMGRAVTAVAGGFTALQGVIALAGNESEELQKTMVKLQAALAISQGLSQLEDLGNAMKNAARATGLTTVAMQAYTFVTNGATLATKLLRAALVTTGVGALVVGIGLLVGKIMEWTSATDDQTEAEKNLNKELDETFGTIEYGERKLKAFGATESDLAKQRKSRLEIELQNIETNYNAAVAAEGKKQNAYQIAARAEIDVLKTKIQEQQNIIDDAEKEEKKKKADARKQAQADAKEEKKEQQEKLQDRINLSQKIGEIAREETLKRESELTRELEAIDDSYEEKLKMAQGNEKLISELLQSLRQERLNKIQEFANKEIQIAKETQEKIEEEAKNRKEKEFKDTLDSLENYFTKRESALLDSLKKGEITEEEFAEKSQELNLEKLNAQKQAYEDYGKDVTDINLQIAETEAEIAKKTKEDKIKNLKETINATIDASKGLVSALADLDTLKTDQELKNQNLTEQQREEIAKKSFERQKALAKAMTVLNYAQAISSILGQYPKFDGGIAAGIALAAATITFGVQLAKINNSKYEPPDSSDTEKTTPVGSKFASGGLLMGKSHDQGGIKTTIGELEGGEFLINKIAAERFMPILEKINSFGQSSSERMRDTAPPIFKTYVVASDMTSEQQKQRKLEKLAQL